MWLCLIGLAIDTFSDVGLFPQYPRSNSGTERWPFEIENPIALPGNHLLQPHDRSRSFQRFRLRAKLKGLFDWGNFFTTSTTVLYSEFARALLVRLFPVRFSMKYFAQNPRRFLNYRTVHFYLKTITIVFVPVVTLPDKLYQGNQRSFKTYYLQ